MSEKRCMGCMNEYKAQYTVCPYCGLEADAAPDPEQIKPGSVLAQRYEVGFALKIGFYTISYIAYDLQREEKVIIKEYYPSQLCSRVDGGNGIGIRAGGEQKTFYERGLTQFLKEAKDLHSVSVPFLIPVQDVFTENATAYMVMPYLNGKTLEEAMAEKKRFQMTETLALMMPVMDITDRLHQKGMLHLNIHPGNIFLVDSGEVILMDSGRYGRSFVDAPMETTGENSRYQAPEIRNIHEKIDGSTDVYSICAIMYQMITGIEPEDGLSRLTKDTMKPPLSRRVKLTTSQDAIIMNGLAVHSQNRIHSVEKLMKSFVSIRPVQRTKEAASMSKESPVPGRRMASMPKESSMSERRTASKKWTDEPKHTKKEEASSGGGMLRIIIPCVLVLCIAVAGFVGFGHFRGGNTASTSQKKKASSDAEKVTSVPNISNHTLEIAEKTAKEAGFKLDITDAEPLEGRDEDIVIKQDPAAGTAAKSGLTISVTVTASHTTLAKVLGADDKEINNYKLSDKNKKKLNDAFKLYDGEEESNIIPGYLIKVHKGSSDEQEKDGLDIGTEVLKHSKITLVYSKEKEEIKPGADAGISAKELLQNNIGEALVKAEEKDFYIGISQTADYTTKDVASLGDAYCIKKLDSDGKEVKMKKTDKIQTGDKILLCLSRGPKRVKIKGRYLTESNYDGWEYKKAKEALEKAKINVEGEYHEYSSDIQAGKIIRTDYTYSYKKDEIEASQQGGIHEGDSVKIFVSDGPEPTTQAPQPTIPGGGSGSGSSGGSSSGAKRSSGSSNKSTKSSSPSQTPRPKNPLGTGNDNQTNIK